eukprot:RCo054841
MGSGSSSLPAGTATSAPSAYAPGDHPSEERAPQLSAASHSRLPNSTGREVVLVAPLPSNDTAAEVVERRGVERRSEDKAVAEVLDCLCFLHDPNGLLKGAHRIFGAKAQSSAPLQEPNDPKFTREAVLRLQARARALLQGELRPELGITAKELGRAQLALKVFRVPPAQFTALFLYSEEIEVEKEDRDDIQPKEDKPKADQLYTLLTTSQRVATSVQPSSPTSLHAHSLLKALSPLIDAMDAYLSSGLVPAVDPDQDVLFRGAGYEVSLEDSDGVHPWDCFSSASLSATAALGFLRPGGTLFVVRSAMAVPMFFLSAFMEELECLVPPTRFTIRDALPISILRMMGVQGSVMLLEDPKAASQASAQPGVNPKLFLQRKLHFLFEPLRDRYIPVHATPDRMHMEPSYELLSHVSDKITPPRNSLSRRIQRFLFRRSARLPTELFLSSGGMGKTSTALLLQHNLLSVPGLQVIFLSLPLLGEDLKDMDAGLSRFYRSSLGLSGEDFGVAEEQSIVLICDSWDEVMPSIRDTVIAGGGLVDLLWRVVGPALRWVVVTSRPEAVPEVSEVLGSRAAATEHWVKPFSEEDFRLLAHSSMTRLAFEEALGKEKLKPRQAAEAHEMIEKGLHHSRKGKKNNAVMLREMRAARQEVVSRYNENARACAASEAHARASKLVPRVQSLPKLRELTATPVLAAMLCTASEAELQEFEKPRQQALNRGEVYRIVLEGQVKGEVAVRLSYVPKFPHEGTSAVSVVLSSCQEVALQLSVRRETHLPMEAVRKIFRRHLRACLSSLKDSSEGPESAEERGLVDGLLLSSPMRMGRLREMKALVSFSHLSLQEFFAAQLLLRQPQALTEELCSGGLDLGSLPAVRGFVRDLHAHCPVEDQQSWVAALRGIVEATRGDTHQSCGEESSASLWDSTAEGRRCRAAANAMTLIAAAGHEIRGWDLTGCRFAGAHLDGLQVMESCWRGVDLRYAVLTHPRLVDVDLREASLGGLFCGEEPLRGHTGWVFSVSISPDGNLLASGSWDKTIKLWNLESGKLERTLTGHTGWVRAVAISPNGSRLVSGSDDGTVKVWNLLTGKVVRTLTGHKSDVRAVVISPDANRLVSGSADGIIKIWNLRSGRLERTLSGNAGDFIPLTISFNGTRLASGGRKGTIKVWNLVSGKEEQTLTGKTEDILAVAFSPNGKYVVSGTADNTIGIWNLQSGQQERTLTAHTHMVFAVAISSDGNRVVSGSADSTIKVWNLQTGVLERTLSGHMSYVIAVAVSPDGGRVVSGSFDKTIQLWNLESEVEVRGIVLSENSLAPSLLKTGQAIRPAE